MIRQVDSVRSALSAKIIEAQHALSDRLTPPKVSTLIRREESFVNERPAIRLSRTPSVDVTNALAEYEEVQAEFGPASRRPTREQLHKGAEETVDYAIYAMSALSAVNVDPEKVHATLLARHAQRRSSGKTPGLADRLLPSHPQEHIDHMRMVGEIALQIIQNGPHELDTPEFHQEMVETALIAMLDAAFTAGRAMHPQFEALIGDKLRRNLKRFPERRFAVLPGQDPEAVKAIGYAASKIDEKRWSWEKALAVLRNNAAVTARHGHDEMCALLAAAI